MCFADVLNRNNIPRDEEKLPQGLSHPEALRASGRPSRLSGWESKEQRGRGLPGGAGAAGGRDRGRRGQGVRGQQGPQLTWSPGEERRKQEDPSTEWGVTRTTAWISGCTRDL